MKKRRNLIIALLLVAALALGVGYAGFSVNMVVNGDAKMNAIESQVNFKSKTLNNYDNNLITMTGGGEGTGALTVKLGGFKNVGDKATVTVVVENPHDFDVNVKLVLFESDDKTNADGVEYLEVTHNYPESQLIEAEGTYSFTFDVECKATSADAVTENFELKLLAEAGTQGAVAGE